MSVIDRIDEEKQRYLEIISREVLSSNDAAKRLGRNKQTIYQWRRDDPLFNEQVKAFSSKRSKQDEKKRVVIDPLKESPPMPGFAEFRRKYIGRPVQPHQEAIVEALEDFTNQVVIILGPPGSGKDTTAGDYILWRVGDDKEGLRVAWIMESENFSRRRLHNRLAPYLTDETTYSRAPLGPDCTIPTGSLIDDYGPYRWQPEFIWEDGTPVARHTWSRNEMYFVRVAAPEADPNLWATGVDGALYGARIDEMVLSDVFTRRNQKNATVMDNQMGWLHGDAMSRLDEGGRLVVLGTRVSKGDNNGRLLEEFVGDSPIVHENGYYRKHQNGVATVIYPAIQVNPDGQEESYWEERFPFESYLQAPDGERHQIDGMGKAQYKELSQLPGMRRVRGLKEIRKRMGPAFETVYQQNPPAYSGGEFSDTVLDACDDPERTLGVVKPNELLVVGADPARTGGAAWLLWGVDVKNNTATVVDTFFGTKLGTVGIRNKLVMEPIVKYMPLWYDYEINHESAILDHPDIIQLFKDTGTNLYKHKTHQHNRGDSEIGVPSLSLPMRTGTIRFPTMTSEDRVRMDQLKQHFRNFDESDMRSKSGQAGHEPDDLAFAAWIGYVKVRELFKTGARRFSTPVLRGLLPGSVQRRRNKFQDQIEKFNEDSQKRRWDAADVPARDDLVALFNYQRGDE